MSLWLAMLLLLGAISAGIAGAVGAGSGAVGTALAAAMLLTGGSIIGDGPGTGEGRRLMFDYLSGGTRASGEFRGPRRDHRRSDVTDRNGV